MSRLLPTTKLLSVELLKIRKRWLFYILFLIMVLGAAVLIWLAGYSSWRGERGSGGDFEFASSALHTFALPWSLAALLDTGQFWGGMLVGILTASIVATEYSWGTVRLALSRGQTRNHYLTTKLIGIGIIASAGMLLALAIGLIFSVIATNVAGLPVTFDTPDGPSFAGAVLMVVRAAYAVLPYGLLAFALTVVGRSTTIGVVGIVLFMFIEAIMIAVLGGLGGVGPDVRAFMIGHNVAALIAANRIGFTDYNSFAPREMLPAFELPDPFVAAFVIAVYCAIFLAIAYYVFQKRDLGVESSGN